MSILITSAIWTRIRQVWGIWEGSSCASIWDTVGNHIPSLNQSTVLGPITSSTQPSSSQTDVNCRDGDNATVLSSGLCIPSKLPKSSAGTRQNTLQLRTGTRTHYKWLKSANEMSDLKSKAKIWGMRRTKLKNIFKIDNNLWNIFKNIYILTPLRLNI